MVRLILISRRQSLFVLAERDTGDIRLSVSIYAAIVVLAAASLSLDFAAEVGCTACEFCLLSPRLRGSKLIDMDDFRMKLRRLPSASLSVLLLLTAVSHAVAHATDDGVERRLDDEDPASSQIDNEATMHEQSPFRHNAPGVRKMSRDEGEKFFFEYWTWNDADGSVAGNTSGLAPRDINKADLPSRAHLRPALSLHTNERADSFQLAERYSGPARRALSILLGRGFECPAGTYSCTSINKPDSCCNVGDTCQGVQDTGLGSVGCCPPGESCSGSLGSCAPNYTSCPSNLGGGCCIPGYECVTGGCKGYLIEFCPPNSH